MQNMCKHIHLVGIGGIGMSALAKWFLHADSCVSGSDIAKSDITDELNERGVKITIGHDAQNLPEDTEVLVYSPAVPESNPERVKARKLGIREKSYPEMLGEISKHYSTIVVTGTNGKSTTTAMLGKILVDAGYDPTVLVGSLVPDFEDGNLRLGNSRFFVVEGCEYRAHMLHLDPEMIVLTNIEEDHLDFYRDIEHIKETFQAFVDKLKGKGIVIHNVSDEHSQELSYPHSASYGKESDAEYVVGERRIRNGVQAFMMSFVQDGHHIHEVDLTIPGEFNMMNAAAAVAAAMELGVPFESCSKSLTEFSGIWRRFERVGTFQGAEVISDYAHHPTAIKGAIESTREFFPDSRVVLCYEPHQHNRTKELFDGFVESLALADMAVISEIYDVAGRNENDEVSSKDLVEKIAKDSVVYAKDHDDALSKLRDIVKEGDVLVVMGAGDIDNLARKIVKL
jgi:UDP-N-acetylmuramate--alanine ligase